MGSTSGAGWADAGWRESRCLEWRLAWTLRLSIHHQHSGQNPGAVLDLHAMPTHRFGNILLAPSSRPVTTWWSPDMDPCAGNDGKAFRLSATVAFLELSRRIRERNGFRQNTLKLNHPSFVASNKYIAVIFSCKSMGISEGEYDFERSF